MTNLYRHRVVWSGFSGGPGVSTFYGLVDGPLLTNLRAFFDSMKALFPGAVGWEFESSGDIIESTTGALTGTWTGAPVLPVYGTGVGAYIAPAGLTTTWLTDTVVDGSRLRGRTFLVPLNGNQYDAAGTIESGSLAALRGWVNTFRAAEVGDLVVWHRPRAARAADGSRPAVTARPGSHGLVTGSSVADKVAVLRSRRD